MCCVVVLSNFFFVYWLYLLFCYCYFAVLFYTKMWINYQLWIVVVNCIRNKGKEKKSVQYELILKNRKVNNNDKFSFFLFDKYKKKKSKDRKNKGSFHVQKLFICQYAQFLQKFHLSSNFVVVLTQFRPYTHYLVLYTYL